MQSWPKQVGYDRIERGNTKGYARSDADLSARFLVHAGDRINYVLTKGRLFVTVLILSSL